MSNSDSFIEEVSEEVRRDRLFRLWKKYGATVLGAVALVVVGAAAATWWRAEQRAVAERAGGAILAATRLDSPDAVAAALIAEAQTRSGGPALIARFSAATAKAEAGDDAGAVALYQSIVESADVARVYRDLAALKAAAIRLRGGDPQAVIAALEPLAAEGAPFRLLAAELQGAAYVAAGELESARVVFEAIRDDQAATPLLRARVAESLTALGAEPG